ncbi:MAG TPA: IS66 family transposase, partial [Gammaproteobacteria bacterium]|nr:IS66 family transposase [Gammaproteobacteria bacterium]
VKASEGLLAHIVVSKMHDRQPLYHLEKYGRAVEISRETMARWVIQLVSPLQPLYNLMKDEVIAYDIASIDATTLQVLKEPGRPAERKSYVYCVRGGPPDRSVVLYDYNHEAHKQFVDNWFEGYQGTVHMDADPFFELFTRDPDVHPSFCNAHARRKFEAVKKQAKKQGLAHEALRFYKQLYRIEHQAKQEQLSAQARYALRQKESKPIMAHFKAWLDANYPFALPQSPLGKAFRYTLDHWEGLSRFLDDGRLEIDNNLTEQAIKPFVIARKNFLFSDSMAGADALCMHFSLIRTALAHKLSPYEYYVAVLKQIPHCETVEDYEKLLPWNIQHSNFRVPTIKAPM